jgi:hypothetical protein
MFVAFPVLSKYPELDVLFKLKAKGKSLALAPNIKLFPETIYKLFFD